MSCDHGIHSCLGAPLARLESEVSCTRILERYSDSVADSGTDRLRQGHVVVAGPDPLHVQFQRAEAQFGPLGAGGVGRCAGPGRPARQLSTREV